jgi:primosomal protein N' (replication factor Y)
MYAEVVVNIAHTEVDRIFNYSIPPTLTHKLEIGTSVTVPFGRGNKPTEGFVVGFSDTLQTKRVIKPILSANHDVPLFNVRLLKLARWMQQKYYTTLIDCLKAIMPTGVGLKRETVIAVTGAPPGKLTNKQAAVLEFLCQ